MKIQIQKPLFAWDCLEDYPQLLTIQRLFECIPDGPLLDSLRRARGRGRDEYPVHILWPVVVLSIALRHRQIEACLGELGRNPTLLELLGVEGQEQLPNIWNLSRFLEVLGKEPHRSHLERVFNVMAERLGVAVPDLGRDLAGGR